MLKPFDGMRFRYPEVGLFVEDTSPVYQLVSPQ